MMNLALLLILSASIASAEAEEEWGSYNSVSGRSRNGKLLSLFNIVSFPVSKMGKKEM